MGLQVRLGSDDPRFYDPNRDFAHCYDSVTMAAMKSALQLSWPEMAEIREKHQITTEELTAAFNSYAEVVRTSVDFPDENIKMALLRTGFFKHRSATQIIVLAYIGMVVTGLFFRGRRNATLVERGPAVDYSWICHAAKQMQLALSMPRWRRTLYFWTRPWARMWRRSRTRKVTA